MDQLTCACICSIHISINFFFISFLYPISWFAICDRSHLRLFFRSLTTCLWAYFLFVCVYKCIVFCVGLMYRRYSMDGRVCISFFFTRFFAALRRRHRQQSVCVVKSLFFLLSFGFFFHFYILLQWIVRVRCLLHST